MVLQIKSIKTKVSNFFIASPGRGLYTCSFTAITDNFSSTCKNMLSKFIKLLKCGTEVAILVRRSMKQFSENSDSRRKDKNRRKNVKYSCKAGYMKARIDRILLFSA